MLPFSNAHNKIARAHACNLLQTNMSYLMVSHAMEGLVSLCCRCYCCCSGYCLFAAASPAARHAAASPTTKASPAGNVTTTGMLGARQRRANVLPALQQLGVQQLVRSVVLGWLMIGGFGVQSLCCTRLGQRVWARRSPPLHLPCGWKVEGTFMAGVDEGGWVVGGRGGGAAGRSSASGARCYAAAGGLGFVRNPTQNEYVVSPHANGLLLACGLG